MWVLFADLVCKCVQTSGCIQTRPEVVGEDEAIYERVSAGIEKGRIKAGAGVKEQIKFLQLIMDWNISEDSWNFFCFC